MDSALDGTTWGPPLSGAPAPLLLLMPVLVHEYGPKQAVPIMAVAAVMANLSRILAWWRQVDWRACAAYSLTGIPAAALGARTLLVLPSHTVDVAIGLFLTLLAPKGVGAVIGPLVELLAAIPSVILGFWGLLVLAPFLQEHVEPFLHDHLGFIPIFGEPKTTGLSLFTASLILTIMVIPIIASITRDLFRSVPVELQDGASALGATRWEVVRGIILPTTSSGVIAACILGLGRALGEAIAVSQVIGAGFQIKSSLFETGNTLAAQIALQFPGALTELHKASLYYCGVILLVIGLTANLLAQWIGNRFGYAGVVAR